jgi:hypothetical protein
MLAREVPYHLSHTTGTYLFLNSTRAVAGLAITSMGNWKTTFVIGLIRLNQ